ncbi:atypical rio rio2 protein kinase [Nannochloropsis oceanica]
MKLDVTCMRYLSKDDYRVLTAVEMGMKNHDVVPVELIVNIAKLRHGGAQKFLNTLLRFKLIYNDKTTYDGYRLTYGGYDILALKTFYARGHISGVGQKVGVGKESDIYVAQTESGDEVILKFHRLGRVSFRAVKNKRDYLQHRKSASWLYMSRLAALREFAFMKALHTNGFPTPIPIDQNRHVVLMSRVEGFPMFQVKQGNMAEPEKVFPVCIDLIVRMARRGLVHCDFNEFNLMIDEGGRVTLIDFPQMISTSHINAKEMFERDVSGVVKFFAMKMHYVPEDCEIPKFEDILAEAQAAQAARATRIVTTAKEGEEGGSGGGKGGEGMWNLDEAVKASGYKASAKEEARFLEVFEAERRRNGPETGESAEEEEEEEEDFEEDFEEEGDEEDYKEEDEEEGYEEEEKEGLEKRAGGEEVLGRGERTREGTER